MDTRTYLEDKIQHYELVINKHKLPSAPLYGYIDFIEELKKECSSHLYKLKEVDTQAAIEAKTSAGYSVSSDECPGRR